MNTTPPDLDKAVNLSDQVSNPSSEQQTNPLLDSMQSMQSQMQELQNSVPTNNPATGNPLLQKVQMPGKIYTLPSRGILYKNGELDASVINGEVHVKPMSALDEIKIKNADMLFNGSAFTEVISECVPQIKNPLDLFSKDVDALMTYIRMVTYGDSVDYDYQHDCKDSKNHKYKIDLNKIVSQITMLDEVMYRELFTLTLANGQVVQLEPIRLKHLVEVLQNDKNESEMTAAELQMNLLDNMSKVIARVDDVTDKMFIDQWLKVLDPISMKAIGDKLENSYNWGIPFREKVSCGDCGSVIELDIPINPIYFFSA